MIALDRYQTRPMTEADIAQVTEIERESFPTAWPRTAYKRELANKLASYVVVVDRQHAPVQPRLQRRNLLGRLRHDDTPQTQDYVVGYVGLWFMVDEAHIVAIAVREAYRRRGLGELLLAQAIELAMAKNQEIVTLEVRRSNFAAQTLYEKYRFLKVGIRRRYYSDNHEDAVIMSTPPIHGGSFREYMIYLKSEREKRWSEEES
jgi:ribosomal-protein-alanine N-acetyltransferase